MDTTKKELAIVLGATANMSFALFCVVQDIKKYLNKQFELIIYHKDIPEKEQAIINKIIPSQFIEYDIDSLNVRHKSLNRYSRLMFARYECFDLLDEYKKVLWLDIDVIIQKYLSPLIDMDVELAMWRNDIHKNSFNFAKNLGNYDLESNYFNSGVLLISDKLKDYGQLKQWCYDKTLLWGPYLVCPDQGVLNMMIQEFNIQVTELDEIYNCHPEKPLVKESVIVHPYAEEKFWNYYYNFEQWNNNYKNWIKLGGTPYKGKQANMIDKFFIQFKKKYMPDAPDPMRHTGKFFKYIYSHNKKRYQKTYLHYLTRTLFKKTKPPFGFYKTVQEYKEKNPKTVDIIPISEDERFKVQSYKTIEDTSIRYVDGFCKGDFVLCIKNGRIWGDEGIIITHDNRLIADSKITYGIDSIDEHRMFSAYKLPEVRCIKGNVAVIAGMWWGCYYHFVLEILPKLFMVEKTGIQIDKYVFNKPLGKFQEEFMALFGVPREKVIYIDENTYLKAENLIVPSFPGNIGSLPGWVINEYRDRLKPVSNENNPKRIFLSRNKAQRRKIVNEDEVFSLLEPLGFVKIFPEDYSVAEQVKMFAGIEAVVSPHGAGLVNTIFSMRSIKIIEIFPPEYTVQYFNSLYTRLGRDFYMLIGEKFQEDKVVQYYDIKVNLNDLREILNESLNNNSMLKR